MHLLNYLQLEGYESCCFILFYWQLSAVFFSHIKPALAISHQPISSTFISQQISTNQQPQPAEHR